MSESDVVAPPLARSGASPAPRCRPPFSARPTRASCISFAAASGRNDRDFATAQHPTPKPRPTTARPGSSHRVLSLPSSTQWQFLTKTAAEENPTVGSTPRPSSSRASRLRARPATARVDGATSSLASATPAPPAVPKRPSTCRGPRHSAGDSLRANPVPATNLELVDPRVIQEAARHETEQELYAGPLVGKSVEIQPPDLLAPKPFRDSCVANAVSRPEFHRTKAFHARANGDHSSAIAHLEKLLEFLPNDKVALFQLAVAYEKTGRHDDARTAYNRVLPLDPTNPFLHYNIGNLLMKMELVEDAIAAYSTAIQMGGSGKCQHLAFYCQRGAAFRKNGDFEKAAQDYARVHTVHHRRRSLTTDVNKPTPTPPQTISGIARVGSLSDDLADGTYSAEQIYSARNFAGHCTSPDQSMTSIALISHRKAMAIAGKPSHTRTEEELMTLGDQLARCFTCCAALDPEARKHLSMRVVAGASLPRGAMLVEEGTRRGDFMFFIARGRVSVYKRFAPRVVATFNDNQDAETKPEEENAHQKPVVSWEVLRASIQDDPAHRDEEKEEVFRSITKNFPVVDLDSWSGGKGTSQQQQVLLTHLSHGDVCGRQGRFTKLERLYSAVVSDACDFFALPWVDFQEVERLHRIASSSQLARFFGTVPLFHGFTNEELVQLSKRARNWKVVGERVICTEGQHVNGLIIVREGQLCQLCPSGLNRPPNLSVAFGLSGAISRSERDIEHGGLHFFTQLEHSDDPLLFFHDSALMHGFLPHDFLPQALTRLSDEQSGLTDETDPASCPDPEDERTSDSGARMNTNTWKGATNLARGAFFNASSSWIPPRKSRRQDLFASASGGVSCAKTALISKETCELIFFTASDLTLGLSMKSRAQLHKNMQQINARRTHVSEISCSTRLAGMSSLRRLVFLKPPSGDDLVRKFQHDTDWRNYKQELVKNIVADVRERKARSHTPRELPGADERPVSARSDWKR